MRLFPLKSSTDSRMRINVTSTILLRRPRLPLGVRMQTFLIQSRYIEALHYNADARLLLIKYGSGDIRSFTCISPQGMRRLLGAGPEIDDGPAIWNIRLKFARAA